MKSRTDFAFVDFGLEFLKVILYVIEHPARAMSTITTTLASATVSGARTGKTRAYRDFLTPSLHRKFIRAGAVALGACYIEAFLLGDKSSCRLLSCVGIYLILQTSGHGFPSVRQVCERCCFSSRHYYFYSCG